MLIDLFIEPVVPYFQTVHWVEWGMADVIFCLGRSRAGKLSDLFILEVQGIEGLVFIILIYFKICQGQPRPSSGIYINI